MQGDARTVSIDELRVRLWNAKSRYGGDDRRALDKTIDELVAAARAEYGDRVPVMRALEMLTEYAADADPLASSGEGGTVQAEKTPVGVSLVETPGGFVLSARCRSFVTAGLWAVFAAVLIALPFRLWGDLLDDLWTEKSFTIVSGLLLAVWLAGVVCVMLLTICALFGEVRVAKAWDEATIFTGMGRLGRTRHLRWNELRSVKIGGELSTEQEAFIAAFLRSRGADPLP